MFGLKTEPITDSSVEVVTWEEKKDYQGSKTRLLYLSCEGTPGIDDHPGPDNVTSARRFIVLATRGIWEQELCTERDQRKEKVEQGVKRQEKEERRKGRRRKEKG